MYKHIEAFNLNKYFIDFYCSENFNFIPKYEIFECIKKKYQGDFIVIGDRFVEEVPEGKTNPTGQKYRFQEFEVKSVK